MEGDRATRRSDEIRRRRMQQSHEVRQTSERRKRKVVTHAPPPVMVRSQVYGSTLPEGRLLRKSRRRYDIRLDAQGAEMRLPALPQVSFGWRLASFTVFAFLTFVLYQFWNSPTYRVDVAEVVGLQRLNSSEVNKVLGMTGNQVFTLDADRMQQELLSTFPEFKVASLEIELPNSVVITITERIPVLIWRQGERTELVDSEGVAFQAREGAALGQYPVIEAAGDPPLLGNSEPISSTLDFPEEESKEEHSSEVTSESETTTLLSPEMVSAYLLLVGQIPQGAQLIYDPVHGIGWIDKRGWPVYFGDHLETAIKFSIYHAILDHLKAAEVRPTLISVEFVHAPYFRLEP